MEIKYWEVRVFPAKTFQVLKFACPKHKKFPARQMLSRVNSWSRQTGQQLAQWLWGPLPTALLDFEQHFLPHIVKRESKIEWSCHIQESSVYKPYSYLMFSARELHRFGTVHLHGHLIFFIAWIVIVQHEKASESNWFVFHTIHLHCLHHNPLLRQQSRSWWCHLLSFPCRDLTM